MKPANAMLHEFSCLPLHLPPITCTHPTIRKGQLRCRSQLQYNNGHPHLAHRCAKLLNQAWQQGANRCMMGRCFKACVSHQLGVDLSAAIACHPDQQLLHCDVHDASFPWQAPPHHTTPHLDEQP